jgi:hypothetical protein
MADEPRTSEPQAPPQTPPQFVTDTSQLSTIYTNFCRVNVTPEELVLDFGLNTQMQPTPSETIKLTHRVVMNFFTAKRLMLALHEVVSRYENTYGVLELDVNRRARVPARPAGPGARPGAPGAPMS